MGAPRHRGGSCWWCQWWWAGRAARDWRWQQRRWWWCSEGDGLFYFCLSISTRFDNKHLRSCLASGSGTGAAGAVRAKRSLGPMGEHRRPRTGTRCQKHSGGIDISIAGDERRPGRSVWAFRAMRHRALLTAVHGGSRQAFARPLARPPLHPIRGTFPVGSLCLF